MALALAAAAVGLADTIFGLRSSGRAERARQEQVRINAVYRDHQIADTINFGQQKASNIKGQARRAQGDIALAAAAQGLDTTSGSVASLIDENEFLSTLDQNEVMVGAFRQAFGLRHEGNMERRQADLNSRAVRNQRVPGLITGGLNAARGFLSGGQKNA